MPEISSNIPRRQELMYKQDAQQLQTTIELINGQLARTMTADLEQRDAFIACYNMQLQLAQSLLQKKNKTHIATVLTAKPILQPQAQPMYTAKGKEAVAA
ncbi:hypothetical protein KA478_01495 [Patescibacteria group bacterium]|nr:hypothetical protein [Patescibacteria group bacterium]